MSADKGEMRIRAFDALRIVRATYGSPIREYRKTSLRCAACDDADRAITGTDGLCDVCFAESHATCARCADAWERVALDEDQMCPVCCDERRTETEAAYDYDQSLEERDTTIQREE